MPRGGRPDSQVGAVRLLRVLLLVERAARTLAAVAGLAPVMPDGVTEAAAGAVIRTAASPASARVADNFMICPPWLCETARVDLDSCTRSCVLGFTVPATA